MEAVGKHNYTGEQADELSFLKGTQLKIIDMEEDKNWYKAELDGHVGVVPVNYITLAPCPWYHGSVSRRDAEEILKQRNANGVLIQKEGAFLVRASETSPGDFSLSVKIGDNVEHFKVLRDSNNQYFLWVVKFVTLNKLINHHRTVSICRSQNVFLKDMVKEQVRVNFDYKAQTDEELTIHTGDVITVIDKRDPNWWKGELTQGNTVKCGFFPCSYTTSYTDM